MCTKKVWGCQGPPGTRALAELRAAFEQMPAAMGHRPRRTALRGIGCALATAPRRASRRRRGQLRRTPRHLLRSDVLDVRREIPLVSEDVPDARHTIAVELRRRLAPR